LFISAPDAAGTRHIALAATAAHNQPFIAIGLQQLLDVAAQRFRFAIRRVIVDDFAFAVDEELGANPLDRFRARDVRLLPAHQA
jgi:hypothetical protein